MYLSGSGKISKSMNGLLRIRATEIDCDVATIDTINGLENIDAKIGENIIISTDTSQNIQFKSDVSMNYDLDVSGNTTTKNLNVSGTTNLYLLNTSEEANFNNNVYVNDATLDVKGTLILRDMADNTRTMSVYYDPGFSGFRFRNDNLGGYIYFSVYDFAGNMKSFQFNSSQVYSNIKMYIDNTINQGFGQPFYQGDANSDIGGKIIFVPSTNATDGWQFINRFPGLVFYTNFACADSAGTNFQTFRMKYDNLWSLVQHTFSSSATFNGSATFNSSLNAGAISCSSVTASGNILCSSFRTTGNAQIDGNLNVSSGTAINTIAGISTTITSPVVVNNTITTNNNITQNSTTASSNRIIQSRVVGDITGSPNVFKYSQFLYNNSGAGTPEPAMLCREETSANSMYFFPKLNGGNYNDVVQANDRGIFSFYPKDNNAITLTAWATTKVGIRVVANSATTTYIDMWAKNCNLKMDSSNNITMSANNASSANPDLKILSSGSRGLQFISNATLNASNSLVALNDAVITTQTNNNSSLVITNYGSVKSGLKISTTASTNSNVGLYCKNSYLKMNASSVVESMDIASEIITHTATSGYQLSSPETTFQTTNNTYPCKYRALTHEFAKSDGSDGCTLNVKGNIKIDASGNITFPDSTIQTTAYNSAIGTIVTCSNLTTTTLTTGTTTSVGSIVLGAGTWIVSFSADFEVFNGSTTLGQMLASVSTSSTALSTTSRYAISNGVDILNSVGRQYTLSNSFTQVPTTTTTYYLIVSALFGTAGNLRINASNSWYEAVRIK